MLGPWLPRLGPVLLAAVMLAGCVSPAAPAPAPAESLAPASVLDAPHGAFAMTATECEEGGFIAAYNAGRRGDLKLADVWELADISEEIGNPIHDALGAPRDGALVGNWHMGFRCKSASAGGETADDFIFGYIGDVVKAPAWDTGGADMHFLLSGMGFEEGPIAEMLHATTNADITTALEARVDWYTPKELPRSAAYVLYLDEQKGIYEGWGDMALLRTAPERTLRLWWQVPVNGTHDHGAHHNAQRGFFGNQEEPMPEGEWYPVYWDLHVAAGEQYTTPPVDGLQLGSHNKGKFEHGPVVGQPTLTAVYELPSLTFTSGHVVKDVVLTKMWNH